MMARTFENVAGAELHAITSTNPATMQALRAEFGIAHCYTSYEAMLQSKEIEAVYIATPHSVHFEQAMQAIAYGKHVLVEKPLTTDKKLAEQLCAEAKAQGVFLGEAFWTRFNPVALKMQQLIQEERYGKVLSLMSNYGGYGLQHPRLIEKELAGGALLDIGVYGLTLVSMMLGNEYQTLNSLAHIGPTGVDYQHTFSLAYPNGTLATCHHSIESMCLNQAVCLCEKAYFVVEDIAKFKKVSVFDKQHQLLESFELAADKTGYEYEIEAMLTAIDNKLLEFPTFPQAETLHVLALADQIRELWVQV